MKDFDNMTQEEIDAEIERIVEPYLGLELVEYDIPGLPPDEIPLSDVVKFPKEMEFTETIKGTEYTVKARFRESGQDLLCMLYDLLGYGVAANEKIDTDQRE